MENKQFYILNEPVTKEEFERVKKELLTSHQLFEDFIKKYEELKLKTPRRATHQVNCENSIGNDLYNCKNAKFCFNCRNLEDCKYMFDLGNNKDSMDCYEHGWILTSELNYEAHAGQVGYHFLFCNICADSQNLTYCDLCFNNSSDLFGCIGLKKKKFCLLNKQYSKEDYEKLAARVALHMQKTGEWGEFFPPVCSPFGYNETSGPEYYSLNKEEAENLGFNWSDYEAPPVVGKNQILAQELPENIAEASNEILEHTIVCEVSGKVFKITKQELEFYRKLSLPFPRKHPDVRHLNRMRNRPPRMLWERHCSKCQNRLWTVYSPSRPEIVYCEACYLATVY